MSWICHGQDGSKLLARLEFSRVYSYACAANGVAVPVALVVGSEAVDLLAFLDTGAANCLLERRHGELLGRVSRPEIAGYSGPRLLGREGFLNKVRLGLVDHDAELHLADYD